MSRIWLTSDLHFGHVNIIRYTGRPFDSTAAMDAGLLDLWNDTVGADDEVWVLGDICMGKVDDSLRLVARLHGTIHLVCGNHDRPFRFDGVPRPEAEERYLQAGFASIHHGEVRLDIGMAEPVRACHFPYEGDSHDEDRFVENRPIDDGTPLLHGHSHGRWRQHESMIDVGVDAWAGRPVEVTVLADMLRRGPSELDPLPWRHPVTDDR